MKFLTPYFSQNSDGSTRVSSEQGSAFAKKVAEDYNPIHHADSKRFCVPGDLLFAIALDRYGLHQNMAFEFLDLVNAGVALVYPPSETLGANAKLEVTNESGKAVLGLEYSGECTREDTNVEQMLRQYVAFSGQNFPHILVPLMHEHGVMINPNRPLVIYQSMSFEFESLDFQDLRIELQATSLEVDGKRGNAKLNFSLNSERGQIGRGRKKLVLSGLREYEDAAVQAMCDEYLASKSK